MRARLLVAIVAALLVGANEPQYGDFGKAQCEFPMPSKWTLVRGHDRGKELVAASLTFGKDGMAEFDWVTKDNNGNIINQGMVMRFHLDPVTKLPVIPAISSLKTRLVGREYVFKGNDSDGFTFFILKPAAK